MSLLYTLPYKARVGDCLRLKTWQSGNCITVSEIVNGSIHWKPNWYGASNHRSEPIEYFNSINWIIISRESPQESLVI